MATSRRPARDEEDEALDRILGVAPTPTVGPATTRPQLPPHAPLPAASGQATPGPSALPDTAAGARAAAPATELPRDAPPGLADFITFKGRPPVNLSAPGQSIVEKRDPLTGDVTSEAVYRYVWDDGDYVQVSRDASGRPAISGSSMTTPKGQTSPYELARDKEGNVWRVDKATKQPVDIVLQAKPSAPAPKTIGSDKTGRGVYDPATGQYTEILPAVPTTMSAPPGQKNIVYWDPNTQRMVSADNPNWSNVAEAGDWLDAQYTAIRNAAEQGQIDIEQAKLQAQSAHDRVTNWYREQELGLTASGQDLTRRGQDLSFAGQVAGDASANARALLPMLAPKGTGADLAGLANAIQTGRPYNAPVRTMPVPFDPTALAVESAQRGLSLAGAQGAQQRPTYTAAQSLYQGQDVGDLALQQALARQRAAVAAAAASVNPTQPVAPRPTYIAGQPYLQPVPDASGYY